MTENRTLSDIGAPVEQMSARPEASAGYVQLAFADGALLGQALDLAATAAAAARYARDAKAARTLRAYELDWRDFTAWCAVRGLQALPAAPDTVVLYITDCAARLAVATIARRLVSVGAAHAAAGAANPTTAKGVRVVWQGIQRAKGVAPRRKTPLVLAALRQCLDELGDDLRGRRDRAILLVGFAGALRRSELIGLDVDDLEQRTEGTVLAIRRSKTDQRGEGRSVGIPNGEHEHTSPTLALQAWLLGAGIQSGPVFRGISSSGFVRQSRLTDRQVARVVKRTCELAGLQGDYSGHSLRAGLATTAAAAGVSERAIMAQTGHRSVLIARSYIRPASIFAENAAALVGL